MAEYDPNRATTTDLANLDDFSIDSQALDHANSDGETIHSFSKAADRWGLYKNVATLKKTVDAIAMYTGGKGYTTLDTNTKVILEYITGWGEDTMDSIIENLIVTKKVQGDAFAEIIRAKDHSGSNRLINLKPIDPERVRIILDDKSMIIRYEVTGIKGVWTTVAKENMLHLCNDRVGDEIHGVSVIECCEWELKALEEAKSVYRKIMKRSLALGILTIASSDVTKIAKIKAQYKEAIDNGEVLVMPMDIVKMEDAKVAIQDFLSWIQYLENTIYINLGVPVAILGGTQSHTEASSKTSIFTFDQVWMSEQRKLEQDFWIQLGIKITFNRPDSLKDDVQQNEQANTGQLGAQPSDTNVNTEVENG